MYKKHTIKTLIIIGFLLLSSVGLLFPNVSAEIISDADDAFWTDDFEYENLQDAEANLLFTNCSINTDSGTITLDKTVEPKTYDFKDTSHGAYYFQYFKNLPLINFFVKWNLGENNKFDSYIDIPPIRNMDENKYTPYSATGGKKAVHYFKFKMDVGPESLGELSIFWKGYADNDENTKLFLLKHRMILKPWIEVDTNQSGGDIITLSYNFTEDDIDLAIDENNYIAVCIVATPSSSECTLYTDYVKVESDSEVIYNSGPGYIETKNPIDPKSISSVDPDDDFPFYWGILKWSDYERIDSTAIYQVYYENSTGHYNLVEEKYLDGNDEGFTDSPISLSKMPISTHNKIKLKATLSTEDVTISPKIFDWSVTWQTKLNEWHDSFNSSIRIDSYSQIDFLDSGNVTILPVRGDWPMFGQNPQNTRYQEGNGPDEEELHWYSIIENFRNVINPVIRDGTLYTSFVGSDDLFVCNDVTISPSEGEYEIDFEKIADVCDKELFSSFAVTDNYLILATGEISEDGIENSVYCLDINDNYNQVWEFPSGGNKIDMCFYASPIIYEDKVFITSWSGDPDLQQSNENNKVFALSLANGAKIWEFDLPAHSFSTPAVYNDMVFVGCKGSTLFPSDNFFVLDANGNGDQTTDVIWNKTLGSIGRSSPVIYDDKVYVVNEDKDIRFSRTKVTAMEIFNGTIVWDKYISRRISIKLDFTDPHIATTLADTTPAINDNVLYVTSPEGYIIALWAQNGTELWSSDNIYRKSLFSEDFPDPILPIRSTDILVSSPAYADNKIYVGTPIGDFYVLDVSDGSADRIFETIRKYEDHAIVTSPIISNGLVFFGDENGKIYSIGTYISPDTEIDGNLISIPIKVPPYKYWKKFYADFETSEDGSDIVFNILDNNKKFIRTIKSGDSLKIDNEILDNTIRLRANLSADNISVNPELAGWYVTFESDDHFPVFVDSSFRPKEGWVDTPTPVCTIEVWDNQSGLRVNTAEFELEYYENDSSEPLTDVFPADYTGVNGTNHSTLTADITSLDISENITRVTNITFSIEDIAYNKATINVALKQDNIKPTSSVSDEYNGSKYNSKIIVIDASADDPGGEFSSSDIASVQLIYRHSSSKLPDFSGQWEEFGDPDTSEPYSWNFTAVEKGGHYELATIATDKVGNVEDEPDSGDVTFILDNEEPNQPSISGEHWFSELPVISIEFSDDFLLDTILYRPNFETEWTEIASDVNKSSYDSNWDLESKYWDMMDDGKEYILEFLISDSLGNTLEILDDDGYKIFKDADEPKVDVEVPSIDTEWSFEDTFIIKAFASDDQGDIKSVELFYRYSKDGNFNGTWISYGILTSAPFEWEFEAEEGNGYYEFKVVAEDLAGNVAESKIFSTGINIFPLASVVAMIILAAVLILITIIIIVKWRKK